MTEGHLDSPTSRLGEDGFEVYEALVGDAGGSPSNPLRILVVRPDRLGDVILSTPVFSVIKKYYPQSHLTVFVQADVAPLLRGLPTVDHVLVYDPQGQHAGIRGFFALVSELKKQRFQISVVLQTHWKLALAIFLAKVRYRIGPLSKLHSYLFYNRGLRQHRSQVEMHETDYNLQLLRRLGIRVGTRNIPVSAFISEEVKSQARKWLEERGWSVHIPLIIVHPGMGGSALNWPENYYIDLIQNLLLEGRKVLVTGGPDEEPLLGRIGEKLGQLREKVWFYGGPSVGSIEFLGGLIFWSTLVIAPSTGPLHLAVALGKPVVTFYSPIRVQSAIRWGPYLKDESNASIFVPEVYCGQDFKCLGNLCNYYPCMRSLTVVQVLDQVKWQLNRQKEQFKEKKEGLKSG